MLELFLLALIALAVGYVANGVIKLNRAIQEQKEFENGEDERATDVLVKAGAIDKDKPWPVVIIHYVNGVQVNLKNLDATDIAYGPKVIGSYQSWKIYDTVTYDNTVFEYHNVAVKKNGRYIVYGDGYDVYLVLTPGLIYKKLTA